MHANRAGWPAYFRYWGKTGPEGFHLAAFHCLDVAAVAERMLERNAVLRRKFALLADVDDGAIGPTLAAFVALHDAGKLDVRFQMKAPGPAIALDASRAGVAGVEYDHGSEGYHQLWDTAGILGTEARKLVRAVTGHHGRIPSNRSPRSYPGRHRGLAASDAAARAEWVAHVIALFSGRGARLPWGGDGSLPLLELAAGLCSVADWIGSQDQYFPFRAEPCPCPEYYGQVLERADHALDACGFRAAKPSGATFAQLFPGKSPRDVQAVTEALSLPEGPCLVIVEAQMGSGKTEAALSLVERMVARGDATGAFIALPTMATSNAMFARVEDAAARLFEGEVNLVLAHSRRRSNEAFDRLIQRPLRGSAASEDREAGAVCATWFLSRKRTLLAQLGVGTVDQAMQAAIQVRHHFVRLFGLASNAVVIDEVHAYDAYMNVIIERLLEWLGATATPVVLLSATLPRERRRDLVEAYRRGVGADETATPPSPSGDEMSYPLVTVASAAGVHASTLEAGGPDRQVWLERVEAEDPGPHVLARLAAVVERGGAACWIRNTVTDAQEAWEAARAAGLSPTLFHARLRGKDRQAVESEVVSRFGPQAGQRSGLLIATQVVEQSLDLDFDLLATDLAPIDLVLQRAGRLHRHPRKRPPGCEDAKLLVVQPGPGPAARLAYARSGFVYDRATLWLTQTLLGDRETVSVPSDIRGLIEAVYDSGERAARIAAARNPRLEEAEAAREQKLEEHRGRARSACIPPSGAASADPAAFGDDDENVQALTREGDSTTLLLVLWDGEEARSIDGGEPWRLSAEDPAAWRVARDLLDETVTVPSYPWEQIERGARARGETRVWDEWLAGFEAFAAGSGLTGVIPVPIRVATDEFRGCVEVSRGGAVKRRRLAYSRATGLRFRKESEA